MKEPRVTQVRPAGEVHAVLTVEGGERRYLTQPCDECPWRKDRTGTFPAEAFRHSASTAYDMSDRTFACHVAGKEKPATCAGFLLRGSLHNLSVRFAIMKGEIDLHRLRTGGHELHASYREMAEANGVPPDDPALTPCR